MKMKMKITDSWCRNFDFDSMYGYDGDDDHLIPFNCFDSARLGAGPTRCCTQGCTDTVMAGAFCLTACETYILILKGVKGQSLCSGCAEKTCCLRTITAASPSMKITQPALTVCATRVYESIFELSITRRHVIFPPVCDILTKTFPP